MKKILIPDEYIPNYNSSLEEEKKRHKEHIKESDKACAELMEMIEKSKGNKKNDFN